MRIPTRLSLLLVICASLLSSTAVAQFTQQGPELDGTGSVGFASQGAAVALSADGNTAILGGPGDNVGVGAAWVWTRSGGVWTQQGTKLVGTGSVGMSRQGTSVALSADGNTALVGGKQDNGGAGAAWVWTRSGGVWTQQGPKLVGTGAVGNARQGISVSLSADGNTALVGGNSDNGGAGAAWVWTRSGGVWTQQGAKLLGSGAVGNAQQGQSVSISADGNTAIIGGYLDNGGTGAAWAWTRSGGVWTQQSSKLTGSGASGSANQGFAVSISADGNTAIVGGPNDGAAWVWTRSGGIWTQQGSKLVVQGNLQGFSVSLSADGDTAVIAGVSTDFVTIGNCICPAGAAWTWTRSGGIWTLGMKLAGALASQGGPASISADGSTIILGAPVDGFVDPGGAWVFVLNSIASAVPTLGGFAGAVLLLSIALLALFRLR
ncbi:MAG: hypothetical protein QOC81_4685 [Thermoanaerobaculia bacterium]|jgi:hypothetical protein|nr:hypothetical protein [Thermoanaerobaculia bacterium]